MQSLENQSGDDGEAQFDEPAERIMEEGGEVSEDLFAVAHEEDRSRSTLQYQIEELSTRLASLGGEVDAIQKRLGRIDGEISALHERLNSVLAERTRSRTDLASGPHVRHLEIASEFRAFIDQNLQHIVRLGIVSAKSRVPKRERVARAIGRICQLLFNDPLPPIEEIYEVLAIRPEDDEQQLVANVYAEAHHIKELIEQAGLEHSWFFGIEKGSSIQPALQEPWPPCDPGGRIKFLVSPAYIAGNQIVCRQRVYLSD